MADGAEQRDFFISFNSADLAHAEAIDAALRAAGFTTFYHPNDVLPGGLVPRWMDNALKNAAQTLALISPAYLGDAAVYSRLEYYATLWADPGGDKRKLVPVVLDKSAEIPPMIAVFSRIDVAGRAPKLAAAEVVRRLRGAPSRQGPAAGRVFNVLYNKNPNFTGRTHALDALEKSLGENSTTAITAVAGMGGIGKTTLAAEYCHRFRWRHAGVWWVRAEQESVMLADIAALGGEIGLAATGNVEADARAVLKHLGGVTEPWLVVYDNAPNPDAVRNWLPVGAARCIVTSRFVQFDAIAPVIRVDQWPDAVTAEYLLTRAGRDDAEGAARLATVLGGLPLAAEQAATYLGLRKGISFDDYAKEITRLIKAPRPPGATGEYPDTVYAAFVKSLEALQGMPNGEVALDLLKLCAFLSPDGVDLGLLSVEWGRKYLSAALADAMADTFASADAVAALDSLSLAKQEDGPLGSVLVVHRLLLEVVRDVMGEDARALFGTAAVRLVSGAFPGDCHTATSTWPTCARLMPHVGPLDTHAPRTGDAGRALDRLLNQANVYLAARGDRPGALTMAEKSVALKRSTRADEPLSLATGLSNLGGHLATLGRLDEAEAAYNEALAIKNGLLAADDPSLAITLGNLAEVYWKRRAFAESEELLLRAAKIDESAHGPESPAYGTALSNLGTLYCNWADEPGQDHRRALERDCKTRALAITRTALGTRHPSTATRHHNLAVTNANSGDWPAAAELAQRAVATMLSLDLEQHPATQRRAAELAHFLDQSGQPDKAARLRTGDISDLLPVIAQIELAHRAWVAEDPTKRHFGPPSFFVATLDAIAFTLDTLGIPEADLSETLRRLKRDGAFVDDLARHVAELIVRRAGEKTS